MSLEKTDTCNIPVKVLPISEFMSLPPEKVLSLKVYLSKTPINFVSVSNIVYVFRFRVPGEKQLWGSSGPVFGSFEFGPDGTVVFSKGNKQSEQYTLYVKNETPVQSSSSGSHGGRRRRSKTRKTRGKRTSK